VPRAVSELRSPATSTMGVNLEAAYQRHIMLTVALGLMMASRAAGAAVVGGRADDGENKHSDLLAPGELRDQQLAIQDVHWLGSANDGFGAYHPAHLDRRPVRMSRNPHQKKKKETKKLTCAKGKFTANAGDTTCSDCGADEYQDQSGSQVTSCTTQTQCPAGKKISGDSKTAKRTCSTCTANTYQDEASHRTAPCKAQAQCPAGKKIAGGSTTAARVCDALATTAKSNERHTASHSLVYTTSRDAVLPDLPVGLDATSRGGAGAGQIMDGIPEEGEWQRFSQTAAAASTANVHARSNFLAGFAAAAALYDTKPKASQTQELVGGSTTTELAPTGKGQYRTLPIEAFNAAKYFVLPGDFKLKARQLGGGGDKFIVLDFVVLKGASAELRFAPHSKIKSESLPPDTNYNRLIREGDQVIYAGTIVLLTNGNNTQPRGAMVAWTCSSGRFTPSASLAINTNSPLPATEDNFNCAANVGLSVNLFCTTGSCIHDPTWAAREASISLGLQCNSCSYSAATSDSLVYITSRDAVLPALTCHSDWKCPVQPKEEYHTLPIEALNAATEIVLPDDLSISTDFGSKHLIVVDFVLIKGASTEVRFARQNRTRISVGPGMPRNHVGHTSLRRKGEQIIYAGTIVLLAEFANPKHHRGRMVAWAADSGHLHPDSALAAHVGLNMTLFCKAPGVDSKRTRLLKAPTRCYRCKGTQNGIIACH